MIYKEVFSALNKNKIKYLVIGGVAVNLYGLHRFTMDLDLMIDLSTSSFENFISIMDKLRYKTKVPRKKWDKLNAIAFIKDNDEYDRVDVFLKNPIDFDKAYKKRKIFNADKIKISCVSLNDLIHLKNKANRLRDWIDIGSLKRMSEIKKK